MNGLPRFIPVGTGALRSLGPAQADAARCFARAYTVETSLGRAPNPLEPTLEPIRRLIRGAR